MISWQEYEGCYHFQQRWSSDQRLAGRSEQCSSPRTWCPCAPRKPAFGRRKGWTSSRVLAWNWTVSWFLWSRILVPKVEVGNLERLVFWKRTKFRNVFLGSLERLKNDDCLTSRTTFQKSLSDSPKLDEIGEVVGGHFAERLVYLVHSERRRHVIAVEQVGEFGSVGATGERDHVLKPSPHLLALMVKRIAVALDSTGLGVTHETVVAVVGEDVGDQLENSLIDKGSYLLITYIHKELLPQLRVRSQFRRVSVDLFGHRLDLRSC